MNKKFLFFDIDGTLIDFDGTFPKSAREALLKAKAAGHKLFLCTGRSKCQIEQRLLDFGFDGIVGGTGAYVEQNKKVLYSKAIQEKDLRRLVDFLEKEQMVYALQCTDRVIATAVNAQRIREEFRKNNSMDEQRLNKIIGGHDLEGDLRLNVGKYRNVEKIIYFWSRVSLDKVRQMLAPEFEVTSMSYQNGSIQNGEVTMAGFNKAYGMQRIIEALGAEQKDTIAFGDGENDLDMLEYADIGVAMGNASDEVKKCADFVTDCVWEDGIANAMCRIGLI